MVKATAILVGLIFLLIGIVGFVPAITSANGMLLGIFHVNTAHNIVHLASGIVFLLCGMAGTGPLQTFFSESLESFMGSSRFFGFFMVITRYSGLLPKMLPTRGCTLRAGGRGVVFRLRPFWQQGAGLISPQRACR